MSFLAADLPANVKIQTLTSNYEKTHQGRALLRLTHLYAHGEHPTLSNPVTVDLGKLFWGRHRILEAEETSVTGNQNREMMERKKYRWKTSDDYNAPAGEWTPAIGLTVTLRPMDVKTFLVKFDDAFTNMTTEAVVI